MQKSSCCSDITVENKGDWVEARNGISSFQMPTTVVGIPLTTKNSLSLSFLMCPWASFTVCWDLGSHILEVLPSGRWGSGGSELRASSQWLGWSQRFSGLEKVQDTPSEVLWSVLYLKDNKWANVSIWFDFVIVNWHNLKLYATAWFCGMHTLLEVVGFFSSAETLSKIMLTFCSLGCDLIRKMKPPGYRGAVLSGARTWRSHLQLWQQLPVSARVIISIPVTGAYGGPPHQHAAWL